MWQTQNQTFYFVKLTLTVCLHAARARSSTKTTSSTSGSLSDLLLPASLWLPIGPLGGGGVTMQPGGGRPVRHSQTGFAISLLFLFVFTNILLVFLLPTCRWRRRGYTTWRWSQRVGGGRDGGWGFSTWGLIRDNMSFGGLSWICCFICISFGFVFSLNSTVSWVQKQMWFWWF